MYKYLVADYILGFALSTDTFFSAADLAKELFAPPDAIYKIVVDILTFKPHWFEIADGTSGIDLQVTRKNEFDNEFIAWLRNGESRKIYQESKIVISHGTGTGTGIKKIKPLTTKKIAKMLVSTFKKDQRLVFKYWSLAKAAFKK